MPTQNAKMDTVYYDKTGADLNEECEIRIDNQKIVVSYKDEEGMVVYKGNDTGCGHFELKCPERNGRATLHQTPQSKILEGFWTEGGEEGFWKITLP
ncbi:MAG: hypothetical protein JRD68_08615 [Deltaproteobacteria bacterium]|nr:hypothetical protein [Deltaproteobacteria bacterium]